MDISINHYPLFMDTVYGHMQSQPMHTACVFQSRGIETAVHLSYQALNVKVSERTQLLLTLGYQGKSVALIYPSGLDFIVNFLACLSAGVIAVPLNVTRNAQQFERTINIFEDAKIQTILTTKDTQKNLIQQLSDIPTLSQPSFVWIDELQTTLSTSALPKIQPDHIAFIQYTSGSTSSPKGVMVSHENIVDNMKAIQNGCGHKQGLIAGGWLPQFHDMGLIGHMLHPIYMGGTYVFMPPMNFIQRPRRWLELISHYKIFCSASPNFGYEHCVKLISDKEDLSHIDLSCWKVALNGSEPVNADTMADFSKKFAQCGFNPQSFFPSYGMAEATLFISGGPKSSGVDVITLDKKLFAQGKIKQSKIGLEIVNCGAISPRFQIKIVDPVSLHECSCDQTGEIWISGKSVAQGYINNPEKTASDFNARIIPSDDYRYLRTGDMGFIHQGMLFVTGRIKELLIIRGRNHYPYDIERTCNNYEHSAGGSGAAVFTFEHNQQTKLAAIVEIKKVSLRDLEKNQLKSDIHELVSKHHEITFDKLMLVRPGVIPKTTSGKIKRSACNALLYDIKK
ncbi:MAG: fatty acyl-AMP ligase [Colwellia sp.]|uniref:fatty acyl-AMP ligase n=1 Tax=Colwellia sp. TaxID=56799 RepID=UPI001D95A72E|nr:fatty acyl-AMP ligase [Colwellia sp.]NQY49326.1 fatty acyl-AMP ligase [Colwellia sp.]